ncbi:MAG: DUF2130 domain-containing protein [Oscillospiraceae bacterium]|jgi:hypothetical protein|nr:DUF2130 domain-containing protein [Oscillospiraceae bacterium]
MDKIICPKCGFDIELSEILQRELKDRLDTARAEITAQAEKKATEKADEIIRENTDKLTRQFTENQAKVVKELDKAVAERDKAIKAAADEHKREVARITADLEQERRENEKDKTAAIKRAVEKEQRETARLSDELTAEREKQAYELKRLQDKFDRDLQLKLDNEKQDLAAEIRKQEEARYLPEVEKLKKKLDDTSKKLDEAKEKTNQQSNQLSGEWFELYTEDRLRKLFPSDEFEPVGKGKNGADVLQYINGDTALCIVWECKNAEFNTAAEKKWLPKLHSDMELHKGQIGIIASVKDLPKPYVDFCIKGNIIYVQNRFLPAVGQLVRERLLAVSAENEKYRNTAERSIMLYNYITSDQFKHSMFLVVESIKKCRTDIEKAREWFESFCASQTVNCDNMIKGYMGLWGGIRGNLEIELPVVPMLSDTISSSPKPENENG